MRPMFLLESGESSGGVSLRSLFDGGPVAIVRSRLTLGDVAFLTCRGGWPKAVGQPRELALQQAQDYVDAVVESDISRVDGMRRDPGRVCMLMRSYARMTASQGSYETMLRDVAKLGLSFGRTSFLEYVVALKRLFVMDDLGAWNPNLRAKEDVRTSPTRHFVDPSIATAALGAGPGDLMGDLNTFGLVFESLCVSSQSECDVKICVVFASEASYDSSRMQGG